MSISVFLNLIRTFRLSLTDCIQFGRDIQLTIFLTQIFLRADLILLFYVV